MSIRRLMGAAAMGSLLLLAQPGWAADFDGDGVDDRIDNCGHQANATQLDSDADGLGDACDADYNNDGAVDQLDMDLISDAFNSGAGDAGYDPIFDHNSDGVVNATDVTAHLSL